MKIAVCISGHLRTFSECVGQMQLILDGHDVSYFVHTWDNWGHSTGWFVPIDESGVVDTESVTRFLKATEIVIQNQSTVKIDLPEKWVNFPHSNGITPSRVLPQFCKMKLCDEIRQKYGPFDVVIRWRPDLFVFKQPDFEMIAKSGDDKIFVLNDPLMNPRVKQEFGLVSDVWGAGTPEAMRKYFLAYDAFPDLIRNGTMLCAEKLLAEYLSSLGMSVIELPIKASVIRRST